MEIHIKYVGEISEVFACQIMMTSPNGNIFRVTGPLCGEFTSEVPAQRPVMRSFGVFFDLRLIKRLSKHSRGWWFDRLLRPLWRHYNVSKRFDLTTGLTIFELLQDVLSDMEKDLRLLTKCRYECLVSLIQNANGFVCFRHPCQCVSAPTDTLRQCPQDNALQLTLFHGLNSFAY